MNKKTFVVFALAISLLMPTLAVADSTNTGQRINQPCGTVPGGTATDASSQKQMICKDDRGVLTWQYADGTVSTENLGFQQSDYKALNDEQWMPQRPVEAGQGKQGLVVSEKMVNGANYSFYQHMNLDSSGKVTQVIACTSTTDARCAFTSSSREFAQSIMPMCASASATDCVEAITATDSSGKALQVTQADTFPAVNPQYFTGDSSVYLPNGGGSILVNIPDAKHDGGTQYMATVLVRSQRVTATKFNLQGISASMHAVKIINGRYFDQLLSEDASLYHDANRNIGLNASASDMGCISMSYTQCASAFPLPTDIRFGIKYRLSRQLQGWFHGRMKSPESTIKTSTSGTQISVNALPIKVPSNQAYVSTSDLPKSIIDFYNKHSFWAGSSVRWPTNVQQGADLTPQEMTLEGLKNITYSHILTGYNPVGMEEYLLWLPLFKDVATVEPTEWSFRTMEINGNDQMGKCAAQASGPSGLVMTNASVYLDGPPEFNASEGSLQYKVAATHFEPDGKTPFLGTYDLVMDSKVARCLYGFTSAPIKASVSVVSSDGKDSVATSIITEKDGYLYFGAYGFTFSNPTVKIKLSQDAPPVVAKSTGKQTAITCVKGKTTKKIIATKPTCPNGYKKK
jgi:hypothetical protein